MRFSCALLCAPHDFRLRDALTTPPRLRASAPAPLPLRAAGSLTLPPHAASLSPHLRPDQQPFALRAALGETPAPRERAAHQPSSARAARGTRVFRAPPTSVPAHVRCTPHHSHSAVAAAPS